MVAEGQECHDLPKIHGWNVLCVLVHCRDVVSGPPPPVSVACCEKQQVSDVSKLVDKTAGLQFGLWNVLIMNNALHIKENNEHDFDI